MQLGMCTVIIKFKNVKKKCVFFVVPGNCQALLGMPDTAALQIINLNIDSIQVELTKHKTNIDQEMHTVMKGCINMSAGVNTEQDVNSQNDQCDKNTPINNFFLVG